MNTKATTNAVFPLAAELDPKFNERVSGLEYYTLDNGLRVLQMHDDRDRSFFVKTIVNAGAIHQTKQSRGLAHFVEHMVFKGTSNIGDKKALDEFAQDYDLAYNAYTSNTAQAFHALSDVDDESAEAACRFVSDLVFNPLMPEAEVKLEKQVILAERKMYNSDPHEYPFEVLDRHYYDENHPLGGGGILGLEKDISKISHSDLVGFHQEFFHPDNMLLICSSGLENSKMKNLMSKHFSQGEKGRGWHKNPILGEARRTEIQDYQEEKDYDNVRIFVSYYFPKQSSFNFPDKELFAMEVISFVLSKRLFQDLRDNQGLAYSVWANLINMVHGYTMLLSGEFPKEHYATAREQLVGYMQKLISEPITTQEYSRAMRHLTSIRWANSAKAVLNHVANNLYKYGQFTSPEFLLDYYKQLDLEYVQMLLETFFVEAKPEIIAVGPV